MRLNAIVPILAAVPYTLYAMQAAAAEGGNEEGPAPVEERDAASVGRELDRGNEAAQVGDATTDAKSLIGEDASSPKEEPGVTYLFLGARYRGIFVPQFLMSAFGADGGDTVYVHGFGPELGVRRDSFEYSLSAWWAGYSMDPTPFKAKTDPPTAWEHVESEINMIYLTTDFTWTSQIVPEFGINYGIGGGIGLPFGNLYRREVYPGPGSVANDPSTWSVCTGAGQPDPVYCEEGPKPEPNWFDGGSKPVLFPWLVAQVGFRIKPHRNYVARFDLGFGTSGFMLGLGADYGL